MRDFLDNHWPKLIVGLCTLVFTIGVAWATLGGRVAAAEVQVAKNEQTLKDMRASYEQLAKDNIAALAELRTEVRNLQKQVERLDSIRYSNPKGGQ